MIIFECRGSHDSEHRIPFCSTDVIVPEEQHRWKLNCKGMLIEHRIANERVSVFKDG